MPLAANRVLTAAVVCITLFAFRGDVVRKGVSRSRKKQFHISDIPRNKAARPETVLLPSVLAITPVGNRACKTS